MENRWIIYRHTNLVNGKSYVGQTSYTLEQRWKSHIASAFKNSDIPFHRAIVKYGVDQWDHEILEADIQDQETANIRERVWIEKHSSLLTENGYNCWGGLSNFQPSEITRAKMSVAQKRAQNNPEVRQKASKTRKENGFTHDEETRKRISEKNRGQKRSEEFCTRVSELNREIQNRPEVKEKRKEKAKTSWQDPEIRKKRCEAMKEGWERRRLLKTLNLSRGEEHGL